MKNLSFVIISLHLLITQLPQGHGIFNFWLTKPECLPCFKTAELNLFENLLSLNPKCSEAKKIIDDIDDITTTSYLVKRICKKTYPEEYNQGIKDLQTKGREVFQIFTNNCRPKLSDENKKKSVTNWFSTFGKATQACNDPNHLKAEAENLQAALI